MKFEIISSDKNSSARTGILTTDNGVVKTPVFMPVGTVGAVKTFTPNELKDLGSEIILGNTYHLYLRPGETVINEAGGLHKFINWNKPILTDSGGFQVFSLARLNKVDDNGVEFQSHLDGSRHVLTPEKSMEIQRNLGSDIIMAFDECPPGQSDFKTIKSAVDRTALWIERCNQYLKNNDAQYGYNQTLFPIVQGGVNPELRSVSIDQLSKYITCGVAIGGLAVGEEKEAMFDTIEYCDSLLPKDSPRYLMGVGKPSDLVKAIIRGIDMFDCVMPTRNGRNGQIFTSNGVINIKNNKFKNDFSLIDSDSSHPFGKDFTKAYVRHLFNINEILGLRIASTLNLAFYIDLMKKIRLQINNNTFTDWSSSWLNRINQLPGM